MWKIKGFDFVSWVFGLALGILIGLQMGMKI